MTAVQGLHIRKDGTQGTTPVAARKDVAGLVAGTSGFGARPGVVSGCAVSGTTGWAYSVSAGHVVTSKSAGDGVVLWGNDGAALVPTSPAPGSGSRIDIVYALHNDLDNGDADNDPVIDVVQGTAGAPGAAPSLPAGAIELGRCTLASGATTTQGGTFSSAAVQYTTSRGGPIPVTGLTQRNALTASASLTNPIEVYRQDTGDVERNAGSGWFAVVTEKGAWTAYTPAVGGWSLGNGSTDCAYLKQGRLVHVRIRLQYGTTSTTGGGGGLTLTPPVPSKSGIRQYGAGALVDASPSARYPVTIELAPGGDLTMLWLDGSALKAMTSVATPITLGANDIIYGNITYESA